MTEDLKIPRKMHFIWLGKPMPNHLRKNLTTWEYMHPDWEVTLWDESNLPMLHNQALFDQASKLVPGDAVEQFQSDILRYELLYNYGGFYADVDTNPLHRIDNALRGLDTFAAMEDHNWVGNTYLGAVPRHSIFRELVRGLPANVTRLRGKRPNHLSGPRYLTPIWRKYGGHTDPSRLWFPFSYSHVKTGTIPVSFDNDVIAVHQWHHTQSVMEARNART
jgi:mannosyltransferase OCH1-like enzyme